jgi:ditrans,polycis-polyprenyl diphosphate synthase
VQIREVCYKSGVRVVTIYAFSIENFKRSRYEVDALMSLAKLKLTQLAEHGELLQRYGASIRVLGQRDLLRADVLEAIDRSVEMTKGNGDAILNVCFPYTSRDEITTAIRGVVEDYSEPTQAAVGKGRAFSETHISHTLRTRHLSAAIQSSRAPSPSSGTASDTEDSITTTSSSYQPSTPPDLPLPNHETTKHEAAFSYPDPETITSTTLNNHMFTAGMPPLDLLVRTSGVERLSDFMLWQAHQHTEIVFLDRMWPEFDLWSFLPVLLEWQWRRRKGSREEWKLGAIQTKKPKIAVEQ